MDEAAQALRDAQAEIDVAAAEAQVAQRKLEQLRAQHKRQELRAPEAGTVVRLATHAGSQAVPGTPAVVLLPQRPLQVRAEINESFAAAVREGMRATVTLDADGSAQQQLPSARVLRISPSMARRGCRTTSSAGRCVSSNVCWSSSKLPPPPCAWAKT